jgi:hypothetical protein
VQILSYRQDPQAWENAHVNDYELSGGAKKDRRWEEGSTTLRHTYRDASGALRTAYYLTYSANNWESPFYGVGYATADGPLGPWKKAAANPVLAQDAQIGLYGPGHGSLAFSPDGREMFYVHHGRPTADAGQRRLYTNRLTIDDRRLDSTGRPALAIPASTTDQPVPSGVAPYRLWPSASAVHVRAGDRTRLTWRVTSADGARLPLKNPLNRVLASVADPSVARVESHANGARIVGLRHGHTTITLVYQRKLAAGGYRTVTDNGRPVARRVEVTVKR